MDSSSYVLALDVGERRIGVAIASLVARLPAPYETIEAASEQQAFERISQIVGTERVTTVVVGLPRNLKHQETAQTATIRTFAAGLQKKLLVPVVFQDEAGTSLEAERILRDRRKPFAKGDIDALAASIILRDYLAAMPGVTA